MITGVAPPPHEYWAAWKNPKRGSPLPFPSPHCTVLYVRVHCGGFLSPDIRGECDVASPPVSFTLKYQDVNRGNCYKSMRASGPLYLTRPFFTLRWQKEKIFFFFFLGITLFEKYSASLGWGITMGRKRGGPRNPQFSIRASSCSREKGRFVVRSSRIRCSNKRGLGMGRSKFLFTLVLVGIHTNVCTSWESASSIIFLNLVQVILKE